jgi:hypothetical protein
LAIYFLVGIKNCCLQKYVMGWRNILPIVIFILIPLAYAFGSGFNYWAHSGGVIIFWILGVIIFIFKTQDIKNKLRFLYITGIIVQLTVLLIAVNAINHAYGYDQRLAFNNCVASFGSKNSTLRFSNSYCEFLGEISKKVAGAGFQSGDGVIDLTGMSPGVLYAMRASSIGSAWIIGGSSGSLGFTKALLEGVDCKSLSKSWLLLGPGGPLQISPDNPDEITSSFGASFPDDYVFEAHWITPIGFVGDGAKRNHHLYRPVKNGDNILQKCLIKRNS